jgi:hypothetical protein
MAINQNHLFGELDGIKCAIVEKNASKERTEFLKHLLEYNRYAVIVVPTPPAKPAPPKAGEAPTVPLPAAETFTIGVTDVTFNPINAIFGRLLHTPDGRVVTLAYWQQKEHIAHDEIPYFENKAGRSTEAGNA